MSDLQNRIAVAMEKKRLELIQQPLARIWQDLALVAIQEMRMPNATTIAAMAEADAEPPSAFKVMADHFGLNRS